MEMFGIGGQFGRRLLPANSLFFAEDFLWDS